MAQNMIHYTTNNVGMMKILSLFLLPILFIQTATAEITTPRSLLKKSTRHEVIRIIDGDTVVLKDKRRVRLVGIQAPKLPLNRKGFQEWPLARQSKKLLSDLILNKFVTLYYGGRMQDRYSRILAHLFLDDGLWVQGAMIEAGLARVYTFADNRAVVPTMINKELQARKDNRGIWALAYYSPKNQLESDKHYNSFQLIHGTVRRVAKVRSTYYLNFGEDWREDFTLAVKSKAARKFAKSNIQLENYAGQKIEVRGWIKSYNGPMIELTHPEQIRIVK